MFLSNKYSKYYYNIVSEAKSRILGHDTYVEKHHIIPRSLGGTNDPENIVKLTAKEHLICHQLLIRMTNGIQKSKMAFAAWRMVFSSNKHKRFKVTARVYESIKLEMSKAAKERSRFYKHSEESKQKIAESKLGKSRTVTWGEKIAKANTGKKRSPLTAETKEKISQSLIGRKLGPISESHRQKVAESKKGKKIQVDPVTGRRFYQ
jgi:hypothetical protein